MKEYAKIDLHIHSPASGDFHKKDADLRVQRQKTFLDSKPNDKEHY